MSRRWLIGMTVGLALAVCLPAQAITLRYAPRVGEVHRQKTTIAGGMETTMEALSQPLRGQISVDMEYSEKALSQTDTLTRMQTDLLGGKAMVSMAGQSQTTDMPTGRMVADVDRLSRVVKVIQADLSGGQQTMGAGAENFPNWSQFGVFPEGDVDVNDTWSGKVNIPAAPGMPGIANVYTCTLLDLTSFQGRKCAKIRTAFNGPFQMDLSGAPGLPQLLENITYATMQGDIVWYYDYENSVYVYGEGSISVDMKMSLGGGNVPAGNMTTKMLMNINTALQP